MGAQAGRRSKKGTFFGFGFISQVSGIPRPKDVVRRLLAHSGGPLTDGLHERAVGARHHRLTKIHATTCELIGPARKITPSDETLPRRFQAVTEFREITNRRSLLRDERGWSWLAHHYASTWHDFPSGGPLRNPVFAQPVQNQLLRPASATKTGTSRGRVRPSSSYSSAIISKTLTNSAWASAEVLPMAWHPGTAGK